MTTVAGQLKMDTVRTPALLECLLKRACQGRGMKERLLVNANSSTHIHPYIQHISKGEALLRQRLSSFQLAEVNVELARLQHFFVFATAKRQTGGACWTASSIVVGCKTKNVPTTLPT